MAKGHEYFSQSITTLQVTLFVKRKHIDAFEITVDAFQDVSTQLAGKEFGFWLNQICLLNAREGLLSQAPCVGQFLVAGFLTTLFHIC